jgi:hypothetical protein
MKLKLLIFCVAASSVQANGAWLVVALFVAASPAFDCISAGYVICQQMDVDAAVPLLLLDVLPSNCTVYLSTVAGVDPGGNVPVHFSCILFKPQIPYQWL